MRASVLLVFAAAFSVSLMAQAASVELLQSGNPQVTQNKVTIEGETQYGVGVGPYTLSVDGQTTTALDIDFFDPSATGTWTANITTFGTPANLSQTYHPTDGQEYEEEAYILSQITKSGADVTGLQDAAWDIMAYGITNSTYKYLIGDNSYIDAALANYSKIDLSGVEIISEANPGDGSEPEFIADIPATAQTPEPSSLLLLSTGVLGFAGAVRRRFGR